MQKATRSEAPNRITFIQVLIYVVFILAAISIAAAVGAMTQTEPDVEVAIFFFVIGFISMGLAGYILFLSRKRVASLKVETPQILTTIECASCHEKVTREFQRGDYVFKEGEKCPKCQTLGTITAIYREVKEKEKPVTV